MLTLGQVRDVCGQGAIVVGGQQLGGDGQSWNLGNFENQFFDKEQPKVLASESLISIPFEWPWEMRYWNLLTLKKRVSSFHQER